MAARELAITALLVSVISPGLLLGATFSDDFEDNSIDTRLWVLGGQTRDDGAAWNHNHDEQHSGTDPDGYLRMRVWGQSYGGATGGAEEWVRSTYNYNDGQSHLINFSWEPIFDDQHYNAYYVQITDGQTYPTEFLHWAQNDHAGTTDLLWSEPTENSLQSRHRAWYFDTFHVPIIDPSVGTGRFDWSIVIDPTGTASLYDGPSATGAQRIEASLDATADWYLRFLVVDGHHGGTGDASLNLYSFSSVSSPVPEPASLILWSGLGTMGLIAARRKRKAG